MQEPGPRILVIDDEQHQLDTVCRGLLLYGYRCQGVLSVEAALDALLSQEGKGYDLVLTDLTMPARSGLHLIEQIQERWPELQIVVITGLAATEETALVRKMNLALLQKPFDPDTLDATLRRVLGQDNAPRAAGDGRREAGAGGSPGTDGGRRGTGNDG